MCVICLTYGPHTALGQNSDDNAVDYTTEYQLHKAGADNGVLYKPHSPGPDQEGYLLEHAAEAATDCLTLDSGKPEIVGKRDTQLQLSWPQPICRDL